MKTTTSTRQQADNNDDLYIVDKLVNLVVPALGTILTKKEAQEYVWLRDTKVVIKRAKS